MELSRVASSLAITFAALGALACDIGGSIEERSPMPEAPAEPAPAPAPTAEAEPVAVEPEAVTPAPSSPDATAFFVTRRGVAALSKDGFSTLADSAGASSLVHGRDGELYTIVGGSVHRVLADRLHPMSRRYLTANAGFAVDSEGVLWGAGADTIERVDGEARTSFDRTALGLGPDEYLHAIDIGSDDSPWVVSDHSVFHFDGKAWTEVPFTAPLHSYERLENMVVADERVVVATSERVFEVVPKVSRLPRAGESWRPLLAVSRSGLLAYGGSDKVTVSGAKGASYRGGRDYHGKNVDSIAVDDQDRVWIGHSEGVAVVGPKGVRAEWPTGSFEDIAGTIGAIAVQGDGPPLPKAEGGVASGALEGVILDGGKPLANAKVEACASPDLYFTRTPCTSGKPRLKGKTDAEGKFHFDEVPIGKYGLAIGVGRGRWKINIGGVTGYVVDKGGTADTGSIDVAG